MLFCAADNFQEKLAWLVKSREGEVLWPYSESRWSYKLHFCVQKPRVNVVNIKQFSRSVMSDSLLSHGLQHARPPCLSPTPGVHPNSCSLSRWCHPTISSSVIPFSSRLHHCLFLSDLWDSLYFLALLLCFLCILGHVFNFIYGVFCPSELCFLIQYTQIYHFTLWVVLFISYFKNSFPISGASQVVTVVKNPPANVGDMRCRSDPWIRKIPWRRK